MALDRSFVEKNRAATNRIRNLASSLSDEQLKHPVGEHWTVGVVFAHIAFWDRRVMAVLDASEREGKASALEVDIVVNDISLPLWLAIPPREAAQIAVATAEQLDQRLEAFAPELLEQIAARNIRLVERVRHRTEHLDEAEQALKA
jgi:hypothetical protein